VAAPNTFAGGALDRAHERRTDAEWLAERLADAASRAVVATADGVLVHGAAPAFVPLAAALADGGGDPVLLGVDERGAVFAVDPGAERAAGMASGAALRGLRDVAAEAGQADGGLLAYAVALLNWHRRHGFCANCGAPTRSAEAGHVRACPRCGAQHHPRTDPVVIMTVHDADGDRLLLGRQPSWPDGRYSALAGFVEPGESLEEAVAREVREEAGVEVAAPEYVASQPWPFPSSLMLGFFADYAGGEASVRDHELEDVRWFARAELEGIRAGTIDGLHLPPPIAIARRLIDEWLDG
jgi:NAD+ diphosphatase